MHKKPKPVMCSKKRRGTNEGEQWGTDFPIKQTQLLQAKSRVVEINNSVGRFNTWLDSIGKEDELISSELCKNKLYQREVNPWTVRSFHIRLINAPERDGDRQMKEMIFLKITANNFFK